MAVKQSIAQYPNGFTDGVAIRGYPILSNYSGNIWWVDSNAAQTGDGKFNRPFATIDIAINHCAVGDTILVKAGHAETLTTATGLVPDVAGVSIIGLGTGTLRPTLTFSTNTTANIPVSAANVTFENILFVCNKAALVSFITIAAAPEFCVNNCEFRDTTSILNAKVCVTTTITVNADGFRFTNNKVYSLGTTAGTTMIVIAGTMDRCTINDNLFIGAVLDNTAVLLEHGALNVTGLEMARNKVYRPNTDTASGAMLVKTTATANTGLVYENYVGCLDVTGVILLTVGSDYSPFENYVTGEVDKSGWLIPAAGSDAG